MGMIGPTLSKETRACGDDQAYSTRTVQDKMGMIRPTLS